MRDSTHCMISARRGSLACLLFAIGASAPAYADLDSGKAKVAQQCAECHRPSDFNGESRAALEALIKDVVTGKVPHSKRLVRLSDQEIADVAAYWSSVRK